MQEYLNERFRKSAPDMGPGLLLKNANKAAEMEKGGVR